MLKRLRAVLIARKAQGMMRELSEWHAICDGTSLFFRGRGGGVVERAKLQHMAAYVTSSCGWWSLIILSSEPAVGELLNCMHALTACSSGARNS